MRFTSLATAACVFVSANAHFCIRFFDSDGGTAEFAVPFESNTSDVVAWYSYGEPVANSFNALTEPVNYHPQMANRATILSSSTAGGHDPTSDQSFGFLFGSTDASSGAGTAKLRCNSPEWIGLREDPIRVLDDVDDTAIFNHMSGDADFEFSWPAGQTDGFLIYDIDLHMVCHLGESTGLTETVGLFDDVPEVAEGEVGSPWAPSEFMFEEGVRVEIHKSCRATESESPDTATATGVDFSRIEGSDGPGTAAGHFWYNATSGYLTWQFELSAFESQVTSIQLRNGEEVVASLGSSDEYYYKLNGMMMLEEGVAEAFDSGELTVFIVTQDLGDALVGSVGAVPDADVAGSASRAAPLLIALWTIAAAML